MENEITTRPTKDDYPNNLYIPMMWQTWMRLGERQMKKFWARLERYFELRDARLEKPKNQN